MSRSTLWKLSLVAGLILIPGPSGLAQPSNEIVELAEAAANGSEQALERLRAARTIDGAPVDLSPMTEAPGADRSERLRSFVRILEERVADDQSADLEETVDAVLSQPRFAEAGTSGLRRLLDRIGAWISRILSEFSGSGPEGRRASFLAAAAVIGLLAVIAAVVTRRRARAIERTATLDRLIDTGADPADLERQADAAAERGDFAEAIRLRFIAGILRLDQQGAITFTKGLTTHEIAQQIGDSGFDRLRRDFDLVVYGDHPASATMQDRSVETWRDLLSDRAASR